MAANTKVIFYRTKSASRGANIGIGGGNDLNTALLLFLGSSDANVQTNADSIATGAGFVDGTGPDGVALAGVAIGYAELINPVIFDPQTSTYRRGDASTTTVLFEDEPLASGITHLSLGSPANASTTAILADNVITALPLTGAKPDAVRCLSMTGNIGSSSVIKATGVSPDNVTVQTENFTLSGNSTVIGTLAFGTSVAPTISVVTPHTGDHVKVGVTNRLGLGVRLARNTVTRTYLGNVLEGTAPTVVTSTSVLGGNLATLNSTLNGTPVDIYLLSN